MGSHFESWKSLCSKLLYICKNDRPQLMPPAIRGRQLSFEQVEDRRMLAAFSVTNLNDAIVNTSSANGTLRQAIEDANQNPGPDTIDLSGVTGTINLTQGQMFVSESVTITGPGRDVLTIEADDDSRIFNIDDATQPLALV